MSWNLIWEVCVVWLKGCLLCECCCFLVPNESLPSGNMLCGLFKTRQSPHQRYTHTESYKTMQTAEWQKIWDVAQVKERRDRRPRRREREKDTHKEGKYLCVSIVVVCVCVRVWVCVCVCVRGETKSQVIAVDLGKGKKNVGKVNKRVSTLGRKQTTKQRWWYWS